MVCDNILRVILAAAIFGISFNIAAEQNERVNKQVSRQNFLLYLPINLDQFPNLVTSFESAIKASNSNNELSSTLELATIDYWHPYQNGIRQGRLGAYFVAPHFASWLVNVHKFEPILQLSGRLQYTIAVRRSDSNLFEVSDLANKTICTEATMGLSFLLAGSSMNDSLVPAKIQQVKDVSKEMQQNNQNCDAFSINEHLFTIHSEQDPFQFIRLHQSQEFSNYAYLVHPDAPVETKQALHEFLVSQAGLVILQPMYRLFAKEPILLKGQPENYPPTQMRVLEPYWPSR